MADNASAEQTERALKLWVVLARAHAAVQAHAHDDIARHGLTPAEFAVLEVLHHKGPLLLGEVHDNAQGHKLRFEELKKRVDAGWRYLQNGDLRGADREFAATLKRAPSLYPAQALGVRQHVELDLDLRDAAYRLLKFPAVADKTFLITDSAGINSPMGFGNPVRNSCVFCHNMTQMGNDVAPGQVDLGRVELEPAFGRGVVAAPQALQRPRVRQPQAFSRSSRLCANRRQTHPMIR